MCSCTTAISPNFLYEMSPKDAGATRYATPFPCDICTGACKDCYSGCWWKQHIRWRKEYQNEKGVEVVFDSEECTRFDDWADHH